MFEAILMLMLFEPNAQADVLREAPLPPTLAIPAPRGHSQRATAPGTAPHVITAPTQAGEAKLAQADRDRAFMPAPARRWSWLFEHGSRHQGTLAPRFELDTRHVF
ncbi:MAG: hypothetical protein RLW61_22455 [Gammaproteobacteria bacterium]